MKYFYLIILVLLTSTSLYAQEKKIEENKPVEEYSKSDFEAIKGERLNRIYREMVSVRYEINALKKELEGNLDMVTRIQTETKMNKLEKEYEEKRFLFIETITTVNLSDAKLKKKETSFSDDIKQILDPALNTFKKISQKPRQVQELKEEIDVLQGQYDNAVKAKKRLADFIQTNKNKNLKWKLRESLKMTEDLISSLKVKLEDLQFKILKIEESDESIVTTFSSLIFEFIKTKGKNLILSLMVFILFIWGFRFGETRFIDLMLLKLKKSERESYQWVVRPIKVMYKVVASFIAFAMAILTLYVLNDWVLVTIILIAVAAFLWSSKQYLPTFMEQSKIVLNLGSVREGERVIYYGLPWRIDSLGYYCKLTNPRLSGAYLRINTKELINSHSRRPLGDEPWFPTKEGDWVEVQDSFGEVVLQSPEQVIVRLIGGERKFFAAKEFYNFQPKNLSKGFAIELMLGFDYSHQKIILSEIVPKIKEIEETLYKKHKELKSSVEDVKIDFYQAGTSSLDIRFFLRCKGKVAPMKLMIERSIQQEYVKVCNENGYIIPFNQLTVHMPHEK